MKFILMPSLEHIALVKIGIFFFNQNDIRTLISRLSSGDLCRSEWEKIEEKVIEKIPQLLLPLPKLLKDKLLGVIKPISNQIFEWVQYYREYDAWIEFYCDLDLEISAYLPAELCWTPRGTIDRKRTAEVLIKDENLDVFRRYRLACDYFLEDGIIKLWNRLPEDLKNYHWYYFKLVRFWSDNMKGRVGHTSYKEAFYSSTTDGNKIAAKYFLQKLTPQEREESLEEVAVFLKDADVLCFLLPEMNEKEQKEVFKRDPYNVLWCFLQWPWQSYFICVANHLWDYLSKYCYDEILRDIIGKVRDGYNDCNYQKLLREFWQESPDALKDSFIDEINNSWILQSLFDFKDKENIRLILKDVTITAKAELIYSEEIDTYLRDFIHENEWDFLEFFIRECLSSKNEILKFKEEFEKRMHFKECSAAEKHKWNQIFCFSDDSICKYRKRKLEEGESSSTKRFQNLK